MPYKEKEINKLYYTIGEVAQMFKVNTSHIRFWSKHFDAIKPATNKKGNRLYTPADIEIISRIYHLVKEKGYTLKGAQIEMQKMKKKMRLEGKTIIQPEEAPKEPTLFDEDTTTTHEAFRQKEAVKKSLLKIKEKLTLLKKDVDALNS
jgi:DNA-binding transcriptional MerR regulator